MKSIKEKAKAYDEAIEKFDVILNLNTVKESGTIFADDVRKILPELAESEGDRINKAIYNCVKWFGFDSSFFKDVSQEECLAWLEKQGEHKPAWSEEDEEIHRRCICAMRASACGFPEEEKFVEQVDNWLKSLKDRVQPQPKQEWSEEEIETCAREAEDNNCIILAKHIRQLKSLRPQSTWKPSDEQMRTLEHYMHTLVCTKYKEILFGLYSDLKELRGE